jgi:hypothetical protein
MGFSLLSLPFYLLPRLEEMLDQLVKTVITEAK